MNKNQQAIARFIEKWGTELPSDAWMDIVKLCGELKDNENNINNSIRDISAWAELIKDETEKIQESLDDE